MGKGNWLAIRAACASLFLFVVNIQVKAVESLDTTPRFRDRVPGLYEGHFISPVADQQAGKTIIYPNLPAANTSRVQGFCTPPTMNAVADKLVCAGSNVASTIFGSSFPAATYSWTNSNPAIGLPASGEGNLPAFTATNAGATPITATITVTPKNIGAGDVYSANETSALSLIDPATNTIGASLSANFGIGVAISPDNTRAYISAITGGLVYAINTATRTILASINTGGASFGIAADNQKVYVTDIYSNKVWIIDATTYAVTGTIIIPSGTTTRAVCLSPDNTKLYVSCGNTIWVYNTTTLGLIQQKTITDVAYGLTTSSDGTRVFYADLSGFYGILNASDLSTVYSTFLAPSWAAGVCVNKAGTRAYIAHQGSNQLFIQDLSNFSFTTLALPLQPTGVSLLPDESMLYVSNIGGGSVSVVNTANNTLVTNIAVGNRPVNIGKYIVATDPCAGTPITFTITVNPNQLSANNLSDTTRVCGTTTTLDAGAGYATYNWNNGATTQTINATSGGFYKVTVTSAAGCSTSDSTLLSLVNANILNNDTTICKGSSITLSIDSLFPGRTACSLAALPFDLQAGLVGFWPFCENAADVSRNENNGQFFGGSGLTNDRFGNAQRSALFDGIPLTYLNCGTASNLNIGNNKPLTVSAWINSGNLVGTRIVISKIGRITTNLFGAFTLWVDNGIPKFTVTNQNAIPVWYQNATSTSTISANTWYHLAGVMDPISGQIRIYVNGVLTGTDTWGGTIDNSLSGSLLFGCHYKSDFGVNYMYNFNGKIDDVQIWNRVLTVGDLQRLIQVYQPSISWSPTGATTNSITVSPTQTTTYYVTVSDGITTCIDSVKVTVSDIGTFNPLSDTTSVCGTSKVLDAGAGYANYSWNNGATTQTISATSGGFYKVTVTNAAGCSASDSTLLSLVNANILNNDTTICKGSSITLSIDSLFPGRTACTAAGLPANLRNGLVAYYPFCGNANDESGNGNNGVANGSVLVMDRFGFGASAYAFNGSNNYIEVPNSPSLSFTSGNQSISFWLSLPTIPAPLGNSMAILSKINQNLGVDFTGNSAAGFEVVFEQSPATAIGYRIKNGPTSPWGYPKIPTNQFNTNQWYNVTAVTNKTRDSIYTYLNGVLIDSAFLNVNTRVGLNTLPLWIGRSSWTSNGIPSKYFNGKLDDVYFYDRALTKNEVKQLYSGGIVTWSTGATTNSITVSPTQTTTFYVTVSDGITSCIDSVKVTISPVDTVVTALDPTAICSTGAGQVRLQANATTGYTYQWLFNGSAIPGSNVRTYSATQTGNYRVVLTNALGCRDTSRIVSVVVVQTPIANAVNNQVWCNGATTTAINFTGSVAGSNYSWTNSNTNIGLAASGTGPLPVFTATNTGNTTITGTITVTPSYTNSGITCTGTPITFTITVNPTPTVNVMNNQSVCNGLLTTAINFSGAVTGTTYSWTNNTPSIGLPASGTGNIGAFAVSSGTANPIVATISVTPSANGCTGTPITFTITVNPTPSATIADPGTSVICQGSSVTLTATGGATYQWYLDGNIIPGATGSTYAATQPGIYTVVPISAFSCRGQTSNAITLGLIIRPTANFTFDKYCAGFVTNFTNLSLINGSGVVGNGWSFGDGGTSTLVSPSHVFAQAGTYNVTLVVTPLACPNLFASITKPLIIQAPPPNIRYPSVNAVTNRDLQLQARLFTGAGYQWIPNVGLNNPLIQSPIFNYNQEQQYRIRINTTEGCVVTDTLLVRMFAQREIYVADVFSPNGDGKNDRMIPRLVGITDLIYFRIFDRWGQLMYQTTNENEGWDGYFRGIKQPMETYTWIAEGLDIDGNRVKRTGSTILIR